MSERYLSPSPKFAPAPAIEPPCGQWLLPPKDRSVPPHWYCWRSQLRRMGDGPARARVAVDSKYWLYINGACVVREGGLKRGPTPGATYADVVDLAPWLRAGKNTVAVHHWYFGRDGFSHRDSGAPGFYWEALDGGFELIKGWKVRSDPAFYDAGMVRPGAGEGYRLPEVSLGYDSRLSLGDWRDPEFDDDMWATPQLAVEAGESPWGVLVDRPVPQFWHDAPVDFPDPAPDQRLPDETGYLTYRVHLPHNTHFTPRLTLAKLEFAVPFPGLKVQIFTDAPEHVLLAEYLTNDKENQSFEFPGWMNGETILFKVPAWMRAVSLGYRESGYACAFAGELKTSDSVCNDLWARSRRTLYVTMRDTFMDCPDRERAQWWGDEVIQLGQVPYCLDETAYALVRKGIRELVGWQREDDTLFSPCPSGNWNKELPLQMLASIGHYGFLEYLMHSGDHETIREALPAILRYLRIWKTDSRGLAIPREGDWAWPDWGVGADHELLTSCWLYLALQGAAEMLELTDSDDGEARRSREQAETLGKAVQKHCRAGDGLYASPGFSHLPDDRANAMIVLCGLHAAGETSALSRWLFQRRQASPYMEKYVLEALCAMGRGKLAVDRMKERYAGMLATGWSSLWEKFIKEDFPSNTSNHSWSGGPLITLSRCIGGIAPASPGWERIRVAPQAAGLERLRVSVSSLSGCCTLSWSNASTNPRLELEAPKGVPLEVDLEGFLSESVKWRAQSTVGGAVKILEDGKAVLDGGSWNFTVESKNACC